MISLLKDIEPWRGPKIASAGEDLFGHDRDGHTVRIKMEEIFLILSMTERRYFKSFVVLYDGILLFEVLMSVNDPICVYEDQSLALSHE